jgi:hypothetical protein
MIRSDIIQMLLTSEMNHELFMSITSITSDWFVGWGLHKILYPE